METSRCGRVGWRTSTDKAGKDTEQKCIGPGIVFDVLCGVTGWIIYARYCFCETLYCSDFPSSPASLQILGCAGADHCQSYKACQDLVQLSLIFSSSHFFLVTFSSILNSGSSDVLQYKSTFSPHTNSTLSLQQCLQAALLNSNI